MPMMRTETATFSRRRENKSVRLRRPRGNNWRDEPCPCDNFCDDTVEVTQTYFSLHGRGKRMPRGKEAKREAPRVFAFFFD